MATRSREVMHDATGNKWEALLTRSESGVSFFRNSIVQTLVFFSALPLIACFGLLAFFLRPSESSIILHYNVYFGVDVLGLWWQAYALPVIGLLLVMGHFYLARRFYERAERVASYLTLFASAMFTAGILLSSSSVVLINY